jgi:hypothetical protein
LTTELWRKEEPSARAKMVINLVKAETKGKIIEEYERRQRALRARAKQKRSVSLTDCSGRNEKPRRKRQRYSKV